MNNLTRALPAFFMTLIVIAGCKNEKYNFDALPETVKSFFSIGADELHIGDVIPFTNESENAETFIWNFGDGTQSTDENPAKTYTEPGVYTVKLTAVGPGGTGNYTSDVVIIDPNAVVDTDKELYFIEYGSSLVRKISLIPGSTAETVIDMTGKEAHGMAYDVVNEKIYYCDFQNTNAGKIWRMNPDGSDLEELLSGLYAPYGIAINLAEGKMYIADDEYVSRANLDGSGYEREFIHVPGGAMRAIGFNSETSLIHFYEVNVENLYVAKSDGTGVAPIIEGAYGYGIYIDEENDKIYFDDRNEGGLMQADLNGSGIVKIATFSGNRGGSGIAVDHGANKVYWAETNNGNVKRANLDGSDIETVMSSVSNPRGMFIK